MTACIDLQDNEHAISLDVLMLGNDGEERPYVVVGTGWLTAQGEDSMPKGRLLIYEVCRLQEIIVTYILLIVRIKIAADYKMWNITLHCVFC